MSKLFSKVIIENIEKYNCNEEEAASLVDIYNSTDNWDIVKSTTEVMGFSRALEQLLNTGELEGIDRVFKISGRYIISDTFDINQFEQLPGRIVVAQRRNSQFGPNVTGGISEQYMSRLWSWPTSRLDEVIQVYEDSLVFFAQRLAAGGYVDIEHVLAKFLKPTHVHEIQNLGVEGNIAPNGQPIKN